MLTVETVEWLREHYASVELDTLTGRWVIDGATVDLDQCDSLEEMQEMIAEAHK